MGELSITKEEELMTYVYKTEPECVTGRLWCMDVWVMTKRLHRAEMYCIYIALSSEACYNRRL